MTAFRRTAIGLLAFCVVGGVAWFVGRTDADTSGSLTSRDPAVGLDTAIPPPGGVDPRPWDAASARLEWVAAGSDAAKLRGAAANAPDFSDLRTDEWETYRPLDGWVAGLATEPDGEFEEAALECQLRHEPHITSPCAWKSRVVLERKSDTEGEVVYYKADITQGKEQSACLQWVECQARAWNRRPGPFPAAVDGELLAVAAGSGMGGDAAGLAPQDYLAKYEELEAEHVAFLKRMEESKELVGDDNPSIARNISLTESELAHVRHLLEEARKQWNE